MILVDTSVWIDHLRTGIEPLSDALLQNRVHTHPMVMGELACGHLKNRRELLNEWSRLPKVTEASHDETLFMIEHHQLMGRGLGFIDAHLLASCKINQACRLWTRDKRLLQLAKEIGIAYERHD